MLYLYWCYLKRWWLFLLTIKHKIKVVGIDISDPNCDRHGFSGAVGVHPLVLGRWTHPNWRWDMYNPRPGRGRERDQVNDSLSPGDLLECMNNMASVSRIRKFQPLWFTEAWYNGDSLTWPSPLPPWFVTYLYLPDSWEYPAGEPAMSPVLSQSTLSVWKSRWKIIHKHRG